MRIGFVWRSDWATMTTHRCGIYASFKDRPIIKVVWGVW